MVVVTPEGLTTVARYKRARRRQPVVPGYAASRQQKPPIIGEITDPRRTVNMVIARPALSFHALPVQVSPPVAPYAKRCEKTIP